MKIDKKNLTKNLNQNLKNCSSYGMQQLFFQVSPHMTMCDSVPTRRPIPYP